MIKNEEVCVVIPARDEEATIEAIVAETLRTVPGVEVIVVDDGSTDGTAKAAETAGARVVAHPFPSGNGAALKSGIRAAKRPYLVLMDADGQHAPVEIPRLLAALSEVDMVVGARPEWAHASPLRGMGNRALARVAGWLSGRPIPDLTSGFRALRADYARACIPLMPQGYSSPTTLTLALLERGAFVSFLRLERAGERRGGRSRISPLSDGLRFLRILLRIGIAFHPERFFGTVAGGLAGAAALLALWKIVRGGDLYATVLILLFGALFTWLFGLLAGQIAYLRQELTQRSWPDAPARTRTGASDGDASVRR